jgi:flagellar biogenesis protein FliO
MKSMKLLHPMQSTLLAAALGSALSVTPALAQNSTTSRAEPSDSRRVSEREREAPEGRSRDTRSAREEQDGVRRPASREEPAREAGARPASARAEQERPQDERAEHEQTEPRDAERNAAADAPTDDAPAPARDAQGGGSNSARSWLARGSNEPAIATPEAEGSSNMGLTIGAVLLVLGLAGAAIAMRFKRRTTLPLAPSEARLTVLSSSRVGPKAFAVTAHVNGRVLLLGVTDHTVTNLGWLDGRDPGVAEVEREATPESEPEDDLPEDYPGSSLRASKVPTFASSSRLERFQEVLRGAEEARADLPMRPSYAPAPLDAAALLAAQTSDVVTASPGPVKARDSVSLRRKRRPRESLSPREPRATVASRTPKAPEAGFEGQVAGLRSLRSGG